MLAAAGRSNWAPTSGPCNPSRAGFPSWIAETTCRCGNSRATRRGGSRARSTTVPFRLSRFRRNDAARGVEHQAFLTFRPSIICIARGIAWRVGARARSARRRLEASIMLNRQPTLAGDLLELRPLGEDDWAALFAVASDPLIWEQHPDSD